MESIAILCGGNNNGNEGGSWEEVARALSTFEQKERQNKIVGLGWGRALQKQVMDGGSVRVYITYYFDTRFFYFELARKYPSPIYLHAYLVEEHAHGISKM